MSKLQRQTKAKPNEIVHQEMYDDSFLPSAEELEKLKTVNPDIVPWIMARVEQEQQFRHDAYNGRTQILAQSVKHEFKLNRTGLILCFIVLVFGMGVGGFLIYSGNIISGSVFAGVDMVVAAGLLINRGKTKEIQPQKH